MMIIELGHFALNLSLAFAVLLAFMPLIGVQKGYVNWIVLARPLTHLVFATVLVSYIALTVAFMQDDFSVLYIAENSNSLLPMMYKITAVWGGHEGSMLLWMLVMALWMLAVACYSRNIDTDFIATVLSVLGFISIGILSFILFTSNPFERLLPAAMDGADLNPLLQDIGLIIHPPMLYFGYVGTSVAFAFATAALIRGEFDAAWIRWARPWMNFSWVFLTIGIALGSWWAYYELGWGGWWFWDPVENASFMPWLTGTALIHSAAATEKRNVFTAWTLLLAILTFALSLLGTFLVRSGVITSVHAFASDPTRGLFILLFLAVIVGISLILYSLRSHKIRSQRQVLWISREGAILANNILLSVLCFSVLLGTLYPLISEALSLGIQSVGAPYFDFIFATLGLPMIFLIGMGSLLRWKRDKLTRIRFVSVVALCFSVLSALIIITLQQSFSMLAFISIAAAISVISLSIYSAWQQYKTRKQGLPLSIKGMVIAHLGVGIFVIGVTFTNTYSVERDVRMTTGESFNIENLRFKFSELNAVKGPNYTASRGHFKVYEGDELIATLYPEKRRYIVQDMVLSEVALHPRLHRDLYVALGESLGHNNQSDWSVRIYYKPFIRFIWLGALLMALGGGLAACDKRYRQKAHTSKIQLEEQQYG